MQKITPFLWFDKNCEEAVNYYVKVFNEAPGSSKNSKVNFLQRYENGIETPGAEEMEGKVLETAIDNIKDNQGEGVKIDINTLIYEVLEATPIFEGNEK